MVIAVLVAIYLVKWWKKQHFSWPDYTEQTLFPEQLQKTKIGDHCFSQKQIKHYRTEKLKTEKNRETEKQRHKFEYV